MIDFPNNPTTGQTVKAPNGMTWKWDGSAWVLISSGGAQGPAGPAGPAGSTGPKGTRGSWWWNASGRPPTTITGQLAQDYYLDNASGDVWFLGGAGHGYGDGPYGFGPYGGTQ